MIEKTAARSPLGEHDGGTLRHRVRRGVVSAGQPSSVPRLRSAGGVTGSATRNEQLGGSEPRYLLGRRIDAHLGRAEVPGRDVNIRDPSTISARGDRDEVVVGPLLQQAGLDHRAGRDDADDVAVDQRTAVRLGGLLADGDPVALADESCEVAVEGVVRHAGERHDFALPHVALRQDDPGVAGEHTSVVVERLVEVAHAEQQQRAGVARLHVEVLLTDRSGHGRILPTLSEALRQAV